jgi:hypothetical protein
MTLSIGLRFQRIEEYMAFINKNGLLFIAAAFFILITTGCEQAGKQADDKEKAFDLAFVDGSSGLPSTGQWRQNLAFRDMNQDGNVDIVAPPSRLGADKEERPAVWYGNGKGEWSPKAFLKVPENFHGNYGSIAASDFNRDGIPDLALAMHGMGLSAFQGLKGGQYEECSKGLPPFSSFPTRALISGDFDNDGADDIVAVSEYVPNQAFFDFGGLITCSYRKKGWECNRIGDVKKTGGLLSDQLVVGDVNADGNLDIGVASRNHLRDLIIWLGDGKGDFKPFNKGLLMKSHYLSVSLSDINGDGRADLVAVVGGIGKNAPNKGIRVFFSYPDGFVNESEGLTSGKTLHYFAAGGDLDGDGKGEVVAVTNVGGLEVFQQKGEQWEKVHVDGLPSSGLYRVYGLYVIDVNGDGHNDIALNYANANDNTGGIRVFLRESAGL